MERTKAQIAREQLETEEKLEDARKRMPYHSVRPNQLQELEDLEDRVEGLKQELKELDNK